MKKQVSFSKQGHLTDAAVNDFIRQALQSLPIDDQRVLVIVPDQTRTMPLPMVFNCFVEYLEKRITALDFLVALGTHPKLNDEQLSKLFGQPVKNGKIGKSKVMNHEWQNEDNLVDLGSISSDDVHKLTQGKMDEPIPVRINRCIFDYDQIIICGPVFPHEVVGFSGGNKYFFPGIAGPEIIDISHWLGALLTSYAVIGAGYTPVRALIDRAASMIDLPKACLAFVVDDKKTAGLFWGTPEEAWQEASAFSAQRHIHYTGRTFKRVLAVMPEMYDDMWVGGKGMYKLEPVVEDGGELIIYAPHINEISYTHGEIIESVGYHVRDYFLSQWSEFRDYPWAVLAHSTHVKGLGTYDLITGKENPRITVTLATEIPEDLCQKINLGYRDPNTIDVEAWEQNADPDVLVVRNAGERLYRIE